MVRLQVYFSVQNFGSIVATRQKLFALHGYIFPVFLQCADEGEDLSLKKTNYMFPSRTGPANIYRRSSLDFVRLFPIARSVSRRRYGFLSVPSFDRLGYVRLNNSRKGTSDDLWLNCAVFALQSREPESACMHAGCRRSSAAFCCKTMLPRVNYWCARARRRSRPEIRRVECRDRAVACDIVIVRRCHAIVQRNDPSLSLSANTERKNWLSKSEPRFYQKGDRQDNRTSLAS